MDRMMPTFRVFLMTMVVTGLINFLLVTFVLSNLGAPSIATLWFFAGYVRVFGPDMGAKNFRDALRVVILALFWPFVPARRYN